MGKHKNNKKTKLDLNQTQDKEKNKMSEQDKKNIHAFKEQFKILEQGKKNMFSQIKTSPPTIHSEIGDQSENEEQKGEDNSLQQKPQLKEDLPKQSFAMTLPQPKNCEVFKNDPKILQENIFLKRANEKLKEQIVYMTNQLKELHQVDQDAEQCDHPQNVSQLYYNLLQQQASAKVQYHELYQKYQKLKEQIQPQQHSMISEEVKMSYLTNQNKQSEVDAQKDNISVLKEGPYYSTILQQKDELKKKIEYLKKELLVTKQKQFETYQKFTQMKFKKIKQKQQDRKFKIYKRKLKQEQKRNNLMMWLYFSTVKKIKNEQL